MTVTNPLTLLTCIIIDIIIIALTSADLSIEANDTVATNYRRTRLHFPLALFSIY